MVALRPLLLFAAAGSTLVNAVPMTSALTTDSSVTSTVLSTIAASSGSQSVSSASASLPPAQATALAQELIDQLNGNVGTKLMTSLLQLKSAKSGDTALNKAGFAGLNIGDVLSMFPMQPYTALANMTCFLKYPPSVASIQANVSSPRCPDPSNVYGGSLSGTYSIDSPDSLSDVSLTFDGQDNLVQWNDDKTTVTVDKQTNPWTYYWSIDAVSQFKASFNADFDDDGSPQLSIRGTITGSAGSRKRSTQSFTGTMNPVQVDPTSLNPADDDSSDLDLGFGVGLTCLVGLGGLVWHSSSAKDGVTIEQYADKVNAEIEKLKKQLDDDPENTAAKTKLLELERIGVVAKGTVAELTAASKGLVNPVKDLKDANVATLDALQRGSQVAAEKIVNGINMGDYLNTPSARKSYEEVTRNILKSAMADALKSGALTAQDVLNYNPDAPLAGATTAEGAAAWSTVSDSATKKLIDYFGDTIRQKIRTHPELKSLLSAKLLTTADYNAVVSTGIETIKDGPAGDLANQYERLAIVDFGKQLIKDRAASANAIIKQNAALTSTASYSKLGDLRRRAENALDKYREYINQEGPTKIDPNREAKLKAEWSKVQNLNDQYAAKVTDAEEANREAETTLKENAEGTDNLEGTERRAKQARETIEAGL